MLSKTMFGLEEILANELIEIGAEDIEPTNRAVSFSGDLETLYRANYELRTALRILVPIHSFTVFDENDLYREVRAIEWEKSLNPNMTFAIDSSVHSEHFNHENYVALKVKDAIVDELREVFGKRPNVDVSEPDLRLHVHISQTVCTLLLDSSGSSLHKRGYRIGQVIAPINEVLAAGLIKLTGWSGDDNFIDPMCGSGTILMEAATIAHNIPPNSFRQSFGFMNWDNYDEKLFENVKNNANSKIRDFHHKIIGFDESAKAISITKDNVKTAGLGWKILLKKKSFEKLTKDDLPESGVVLINPPYGERIDNDDIISLYKRIGDGLKANFYGFTAWIISSNKSALKSIGLQTSKRLTLYNGTLECKFHRYELYRGSQKSKYLKNVVNLE